MSQTASPPATHRVIDIPDIGGPEALILKRQPTPAPGAGEVLIEVHGAGVNRADVMQRLGTYPMPDNAPTVPGLEVAGVVAACGPGVKRWKPGDRVCALVVGGGYAEYCVAPEVQCLPVPDHLTLIEAAGLPEVVFTVWITIFEQARLTSGDTLLVHGGASGVGSMAIQVATNCGASVIATAGSDERCAFARDLGADLAINYKTTDFVEAVRRHTQGEGVDIVLDLVGGPYAKRNIACLKMGGRLCYVSLQDGLEASFDLLHLLLNRLTVTGANLRRRSVEEKGRLARDIEQRIWPLVRWGRVKPIIDRTFTLEEAAEAHRALESGLIAGKAILTPRME
ncbi:MAG: NAD(P)H-quinone oxidoreductase [Rhizobiales bacterium 65-9]|nr:NAD(P)H-quinone oxidoreductase [Hyphomicrobiales bacterium]OJY36911.1 MAG: NAD(P)H-quinone oxidoreductase [Rhizobiales bacterium 65-9]